MRLDRKVRIVISIEGILFILYLFAALSGYGWISEAASKVMVLPVLVLAGLYCSRKVSKVGLCFALFYFYYFVTSLYNVTSIQYLLVTCVLGELVIFSPIFIGRFVEIKYSDRKASSFLMWCAIIWAVITVSSIVIYSGFETGGRAYAHEDSEGLMLGGGYYSAYASTLIVIFLLGYLFYQDKRKEKTSTRVGIVVLGILSFIHVLSTISTITTVALVVGILLTVLFHGSKKEAKGDPWKIILMILIVAGAVVVLILRQQIGLRLISFSGQVENEVYAQRIREIGDYLYHDYESAHIQDRGDTLRISWETFLRNPIFGTGYKCANNWTQLTGLEYIGDHSEILDTLAQFGLVGGIPLILMFFYQIIKIIKEAPFRLSIPFVAAFFILAFFNPFLSIQTVFVLFLFIPLFIRWIKREDIVIRG